MLPISHSAPTHREPPQQMQPGTILPLTEGGFAVVATDGSRELYEVPLAERDELTALLELRGILAELTQQMSASSMDTPQITQLRDRLNASYDCYYDHFGFINRFSVRRTGWVVDAEFHPPQGGFAVDPSAAAVRALEIFDRGRNCAIKAPVFDPREPAAAR